MKCLRVFGALPERPENLRFIIKIHVFSAKIPVGFFFNCQSPGDSGSFKPHTT